MSLFYSNDVESKMAKEKQSLTIYCDLYFDRYEVMFQHMMCYEKFLFAAKFTYVNAMFDDYELV